MSIESEINRISTNVSDTLAAIEEMGGEVPEGATSNDMAAAARSIPVGAKINDTTPSTTTTYSSKHIDDLLYAQKEANATQDEAIAGKANNKDLAAVAKSGSYNDLSDKPTIPTVPTALKNPNALTFKGAVSATYDGSAPVEVTIQEGGGGSGNGSSGGSTWDLLINREVAEDCVSVDYYNGDNGESFDDYSELLLLIDLCKNSGGYTTALRLSFNKTVGAWSGPFGLDMKGITADNTYGAKMRRYQKTNFGILPTTFYDPANTASVSNAMQLSVSTDTNNAALKLPVNSNAHIPLDVTNFNTQTEFEAVRIGGYQAVIGAGTVIKVWGCRA